MTKQIWQLIKRLKEVWDWLGLAWLLAGFFGLTGIAISIAGTASAMIFGLPPPFILMAGFCTLAATVCIALAPIAYQSLTRPSSAEKSVEHKPNYSAWRNRQHLTLSEAACLFADVVPTAKNAARPDVLEYFGALLDAARSGDMKFVFATQKRRGQIRNMSTSCNTSTQTPGSRWTY